MRKEKMITRTVDMVVCEVMCVNTETAEVTIETMECAAPQGKKTVIDVLKALYETDTKKLVNINSTENKSVLYGMPESVFIANAKILPPRIANSEIEE